MPKDPPPNPSNPPNGTYTCTCGADFSSWDGSFTYDNVTKIIVYTTTSPSFTYPDTTNKSNGNAIVFDLTDGTDTVQFNGSSFLFKGPNNKAEYKGHCHQGPTDTADGWTATQE